MRYLPRNANRSMLGKQVNNTERCVRECVRVQPLTSSTAETVFRQSLILDWKPDVPGDDRSSFVMTTKSETLILSGMFGAGTEPKLTEENRDPKFPTRAQFPPEGRMFTYPLCSPEVRFREAPLSRPSTEVKLAKLGAASSPTRRRPETVCAWRCASPARDCPPTEGGRSFVSRGDVCALPERGECFTESFSSPLFFCRFSFLCRLQRGRAAVAMVAECLVHTLETSRGIWIDEQISLALRRRSLSVVSYNL